MKQLNERRYIYYFMSEYNGIRIRCSYVVRSNLSNDIIVHKGISISVGHYICCFRADQKLLKTDDNKVTEVP